MRWSLPCFILLLFLSGCICCGGIAEQSCDYGNPCSKGVFSNAAGECVYEPLYGVVEGCSRSYGCIRYGCVEGECRPLPYESCCGNHICEPGEGDGCPADCIESCYDGIRNQGESGVDCGGPCRDCKDDLYESYMRLKMLSEPWYNITNEYVGYIREYNGDRDLDKLGQRAVKTRGRVAILEKQYEAMERLSGMNEAMTKLGESIRYFKQSLDAEVVYTETRTPAKLTEANDLLTKALDASREYDVLYRGVWQSYWSRQEACRNAVLDEGEERIDCGGHCGPCDVEYTIAKHVVVEKIGGGKADFTYNLTLPVIDNPPIQELLWKRASPTPERVWTNEYGTIYHQFPLHFPAGSGTRELTVTGKVVVRGGYHGRKLYGDVENSFKVKDEKMTMSSQECGTARRLQGPSTRESAENLYEWVDDNIEYVVFEEDNPSSLTYSRKKGDCSDKSILFSSFMRCLGIPARQVQGYMVNGTALTSHAWAEYYDGGWVYLDPVYHEGRGVVNNVNNIYKCREPFSMYCNSWYNYVYWDDKPRFRLTENTYVESNRSLEGIETITESWS